MGIRAFLGQDLLALAPVNETGEMDPARLGGFAFAGWCYDWLLRNMSGARGLRRIAQQGLDKLDREEDGK